VSLALEFVSSCEAATGRAAAAAAAEKPSKGEEKKKERGNQISLALRQDRDLTKIREKRAGQRTTTTTIMPNHNQQKERKKERKERPNHILFLVVLFASELLNFTSNCHRPLNRRV